jgi:hypothetical protein
MKKLIILLLLVIATGCSKESEPCKCVGAFTTEEKFGNGQYYYVEVELDCDTRNPITLPQPDAVFCGCK